MYGSEDETEVRSGSRYTVRGALRNNTKKLRAVLKRAAFLYKKVGRQKTNRSGSYAGYAGYDKVKLCVTSAVLSAYLCENFFFFDVLNIFSSGYLENRYFHFDLIYIDFPYITVRKFANNGYPGGQSL